MNRSVSGCECNEILASSLKCVLTLLSFVSRRRFGLVERERFLSSSSSSFLLFDCREGLVVVSHISFLEV